MSVSRKLAATAASLSAFLLIAAPPAVSFVPPDDDEKKDEKKDDEEQDDEKKDEEEQDEFFAIVGGDVHTGTGAILRGATILSKNGKIEEIGYNVYVPDEAETLDATGYRVYPGLVAVEASNRLSRGSFAFDPANEIGEIDEVEEDAHGERATDPHFGLDDLHPADLVDLVLRGTGHLDGGEEFAAENSVTKNDFEDSFDPFSSYMVMALSAGVTTAAQGNTAAKLKRGEIEGVAMNEKHMRSFSWTTSGRAKLRKDFARAAEYLREYRAWEKVKKKDKEAKVSTARTLWVPAVNNHGGFGRWAFLEIQDPWDAKNLLRAFLKGRAPSLAASE